MLLVLLFSCRAKVDHFVSTVVVDRAASVADVGEACATGAALRHALSSLSKAENQPHEALLIAEVTAALCSEFEAREAELDAARATHNQTGEALAAETRDAMIHGERAHAEAAARFYRAYQHLEARWGTAGTGDCPKLDEDDEAVYMLGLWSGLNALLHDKASDNAVGVPADIPSRVARATPCLENEALWHVPAALQAAAWAAVPGSGPADADPWGLLLSEADAGGKTGVRLAYAIANRVAGNSGRDDILVKGLSGQAKSDAEVPTDPKWALLDAYAELVSLHEADVYWTKTRGYRAHGLDELPGETTNPDEAPKPDVFGAVDPFASTPVVPLAPTPAKEEPHAP